MTRSKRRSPGNTKKPDTPPTQAEKELRNQSEDEEQDGDEEYVTKTYVSEMLKVQELMFRSLFDSMLINVNKRVDDLVRTVTELKSSLEFTQKEMDSFKSLHTKLNTVENEIREVNDDVGFHRGKIEYLENQSRRNNVRFYGIPEDEQETWDVSEAKVKETVKEILKVDEEIKIERAHRTGRRTRKLPTGETVPSPRTIICRLQNWKQRELILRAARQVKPDGIYVNEDLAKETLEKRKELVPKMIQAKKAGKIAFFVLDKLVVKDRHGS